MEQTVFSRADLAGANFTGTRMQGALLADAHIDHRTNFGHLDQDGNLRPSLRVAYDPEPEPDGLRERLVRAIRRYLPTQPPWDPPQRGAEGNSDAGGEPTESDSGHGMREEDDGGSHPQEDVDERDGPGTDSFDDRLRKAAGAYQTLESLARENALPDLQSMAFVRRQEMNRLRYGEQARRSEDRKLRLWGKWARASAARATLLYGESPWRVIATALFVILLGAFVYPLGGFRETGPSGTVLQAESFAEWVSLLPESLYFSTLTFTTLGFGDYLPYAWGRYVATVETAVGATMVALLVFVLGRRAAR